MWNLYNDLAVGIPSDIRIDGCVVGEKWTTVRANGNIGIAKTLAMPEDPAKLAASYIGGFLRDATNYMKWDNLTKAGIGVAAMNAYYNTAERVAGLEGNFAPDALCLKSTAFVSDCKGENVFPLPMTADFDEAAYTALRNFDTVVISSDAFMTQAMSKLLDIIGNSAKVILDGYSLPCTAVLFAFGSPVCELHGFYAKEVQSLEFCAISGKDPTPAVLPYTIKAETTRKIVADAKAKTISAGQAALHH